MVILEYHKCYDLGLNELQYNLIALQLKYMFIYKQNNVSLTTVMVSFDIIDVGASKNVTLLNRKL